MLDARSRSKKTKKTSKRKTTGPQTSSRTGPQTSSRTGRQAESRKGRQAGSRTGRQTGSRTGRQTGSPKARSRYQTTARATTFSVRRSKPFSLRKYLEGLGKKRNRRSKARLGDRRKTKPASPKARRSAPSKESIRVGMYAVLNILVLGLLGWLLVWFFVSDRFYVSEIVVRGNQRVSSEAIASASDIHGYSIFWINARDVTSRITDALPVRRVRVQYGLPNKVTLAVEEQGSQIMWLVAGQRYWVDDEGKFHPAQGGDSPKLLVRDIRPGLPTEVDIDAVVGARQLVQLLPELTEVRYAPVTGLHYVHADGWVVYLGTGDGMARRVNVLHAIERQLLREGTPQPSLVDVRFPDTPYYRFPDQEAGG